MKTLLTSFYVSACLALLPSASYAAVIVPTDFSFNTNLKLGVTVDPDVSYLQNILNMSATTQVADSGPGSNSQLTSSFGPKTKDAVIRFQNFYAADILTPAGLNSGTGAVGSSTRAKLNQVLQTIRGTVSTTATKPLTTATSSSYNPFYATPPGGNTGSSTVNVYGISTYRAVPGQAMSVFGSGFDKNSNTLQIGSEIIKDLPSTSGGTLIPFIVPKTIGTGSYSILVFNQFGLGSSGSLAVNIDAGTALGNQKSFVPLVTGVTPASSKLLTQVVLVNGDNFTADNTIVTNLGNISHISSSDGKTLTFTVGTLPYYSEALRIYKGQAVNVIIRVANEYGGSKDQATHVVNLPASGDAADAAPKNAADALAGTSDYQSFLASTTYSQYIPYASGSSNDSSLQSLFGLMSAMDFGGYGSLARTSTSSLSAISAGVSAGKPSNMTAGGIVNPYITNINPYITGPVINPPSNTTGTQVGSAGTNSTVAGEDYFGGVIVKTVQCTSDGTTLLYVRDYAHQYRTYGLTFDPTSSKLTGGVSVAKGDLSGGSFVSGKFASSGKSCVVGNNSTVSGNANQPTSLIDVSVGTILYVQKMGV